MPFLPNTLLTPQSKQAPSNILKFLSKTTNALYTLQQADLPYHGNLKTETVLLDFRGNPRFVGFGLTRAMKEGSREEDLKVLAGMAERVMAEDEEVGEGEGEMREGLKRVMGLLREGEKSLVAIRYEIAVVRGLVVRGDRKEGGGGVGEVEEEGRDNKSGGKSRKRKKGKKEKGGVEKETSSDDAEAGGADEGGSGDEENSRVEPQVQTETREKKVAEDVDSAVPREVSDAPAESSKAEVPNNSVAMNGVSTALSTANLVKSNEQREKADAPVSSTKTAKKKGMLKVPHGASHLPDVVNSATEQLLDTPMIPRLKWILQEVESNSETVESIFDILHKCSIQKFPVTAFKSLIVVHATCANAPKAVSEVMQQEDGFLSWIAKAGSPDVVRHKLNKSKRYASSFLEGEIMFYAEYLRNLGAGKPSPDKALELFKMCLYAEDECKDLKHVAMSFLLRDLQDTPSFKKGCLLMKSVPGSVKGLDKSLLKQLGVTSLVRYRNKSKKLHKEKMSNATVERGSGKENGYIDDTSAKRAASRDIASVKTGEEAKKVKNRNLSDGSATDDRSTDSGSEEDVSDEVDVKRKKDGKRARKVVQKKAKKATSVIVNKLLNGEHDVQTSDEDSNTPTKVINAMKKLTVSDPNDSARETRTTKAKTKQSGKSQRLRVTGDGEEDESSDMSDREAEILHERIYEKRKKGRRKEKGGSASVVDRKRKVRSKNTGSRERERRREASPETTAEFDNAPRAIPHPDLEAAILSGKKTPQMNPKFEVMPHEVRMDHLVGSGGFGVVYKGMFRNRVAAIKKIHAHALRNPASIAEFQSEVAVLCTLRHKNILEFLGACSKPPHLMIITEYMARGTLFELLHRSNDSVSWGLRRSFAIDICHGMRYLHECKMTLCNVSV